MCGNQRFRSTVLNTRAQREVQFAKRSDNVLLTGGGDGFGARGLTGAVEDTLDL